MTFASVVELEIYVNREFSGTQDDTAAQALELATGAIQAYTEQHLFHVVGDTVTLHPSSCVLLLPERPVTAVTSVTVDDEVTEEFRVDEAAGILYLTGSIQPEKVEVTYSHGYTVIPGAVKSVCLDVARRAFENPHGFVQKTVGDVSVSHGSHSGLAVGLQLSDREERQLFPYRKVR